MHCAAESSSFFLTLKLIDALQNSPDISQVGVAPLSVIYLSIYFVIFL